MHRSSRRRRQEVAAFYGFISPWLIGLACFTVGPIIASFYISLTKYSIIAAPVFVGIRNYVDLFRDPLFWTSLYNTLYYVIFYIPLGTVTAFMLALLLNQKIRGLAIYRTIYYLPSIVPAVANAVLWVWMLNPQYGLINTGLRALGLEGPGWLASETWAKPGIVLMSLWGTGSWIIIYLAGLQGISRHLYEAAEVEGASRLQKLFRITIPMMTPTFFFTLVTGVIGSFQVFTQAYIMTGGGPLNSTLFYALYLFRTAFNYLKMGTASAMAWILFIIVLVLTGLQVRASRKWVFYE